MSGAKATIDLNRRTAPVMSSTCEPAVALKLAFSYQFRIYRGQVGGAFAHRRRAETLGALGLETVRFPLIHR